jgi:hypothetical protein
MPKKNRGQDLFGTEQAEATTRRTCACGRRGANQRPHGGCGLHKVGCPANVWCLPGFWATVCSSGFLSTRSPPGHLLRDVPRVQKLDRDACPTLIRGPKLRSLFLLFAVDMDGVSTRTEVKMGCDGGRPSVKLKIAIVTGQFLELLERATRGGKLFAKALNPNTLLRVAKSREFPAQGRWRDEDVG